MLHVGINGFGTIGKRVADAVRVRPYDSCGRRKALAELRATIADDRGYDLYAADGREPFDEADRGRPDGP